MVLKTWVIIGGVIAVIVAAIFGMATINVGSAVQRCEDAGYGESDGSFKLSMTSCAANEDYSFDSVAIVAGNVANSPAPTLTDKADMYLRNSLAYTEGELDMFTYSTVPGGIRINVEEKKSRKAGNVTNFIRNATQKLDSVNEAIAAPPLDEGSDYFNNIITAAQAVKSNPEAEKKLVLVIGSGLSDTQPLNFAESDLLHSDPSDIVDELKESNSLLPGELSGVTIVWSGLGVTASPQQPLDAKEKSNLQRIYNLIFSHMGATFVTDDTVMATDSVETEHQVKPVKVTGIQGGVAVYKFGENSIGFTPGTAQVIDTQKASAALSGVVSSYKTCRDVNIAVEGYQAKLQGEEVQNSTTLSQQRAEAVKQLLTSQDIPANQITATGKGTSSFDGRIDEVNPAGEWDDKRAQVNRIVLVKMDNDGACS